MIENMNWIVYGTGGHAAVIVDAIFSRNDTVEFCIDDSPEKIGTKFLDRFDIKDETSLSNLNKDSCCVIVAIGDNKTRASKMNMLKTKFGIICSTVIHPRAIVSTMAKLCSGSFVAAGAVVEARAIVGEGCIINTSAIVNHDCSVGMFSHIAPGAVLSGKVSVGDHTLIGANCTVLPGLSVDKNCVVGAGSVVTKNVMLNSIVLGNPARQK